MVDHRKAEEPSDSPVDRRWSDSCGHGVWAVVTYVWPAHESEKVVCAQQGSVASGRDASGNTITYNGGAPSGAGSGAASCANTAKK